MLTTRTSRLWTLALAVLLTGLPAWAQDQPVPTQDPPAPAEEIEQPSLGTVNDLTRADQPVGGEATTATGTTPEGENPAASGATNGTTDEVAPPPATTPTAPTNTTTPGVEPGTGPTKPDLPEAMLSPRRMVELLIEDARVVEENDDIGWELLLKFLPNSSRGAFDNAGLRDARRLGELVNAIRENNPDALRTNLVPYELAGPQHEWEINLGFLLDEDARYAKLGLLRGEFGYWRMSEQAMERVNRLHGEAFPEQYVLRRFFENAGLDLLVDRELLGVALYQWVSLAGLVLIAWLIDLAIALLSLLVIRRYLRKDEDTRTPGDSAKLIKKSSKPFGLAAAGAVLYYGIPLLNMPTQAEGILRVAAQIFAVFGFFLAISRLIDLVGEYFHRRALRTSTKFDDLLVPLLRKTAKTVLLAFGLLTVAESLSLPVTSLVTGFGIAGAAIAFASKDTVENLFGSVAVILDRPFNAGDYVAIDGVEGVVEQLGFRSTRIRTFYNSLVTVPNALLVRAQVDNYGVRKFRRYKSTLQILYSTPPDRIEAFVEGLRELVRTHPDTRKDFIEIHFRDFGSHSLDILVWIFFRVPDWTMENEARHKLNVDILRLARRVGVEFAYPTQTLELRRADALEEREPQRSIRDARQSGIEAVKDMASTKTLD